MDWVRRNPKARTRLRLFQLESLVIGYRRLKKIVLSVANRENNKNRCKMKCEEEAEKLWALLGRRKDSQMLIPKDYLTSVGKEEQKQSWLYSQILCLSRFLP